VKLFSKNSNLCDHNPPTSQTDRQTTCDRNTALCTKVHRAVKTCHSVSAEIRTAECLDNYSITLLTALRFPFENVHGKVGSVRLLTVANELESRTIMSSTLPLTLISISLSLCLPVSAVGAKKLCRYRLQTSNTSYRSLIIIRGKSHEKNIIISLTRTYTKYNK